MNFMDRHEHSSVAETALSNSHIDFLKAPLIPWVCFFLRKESNNLIALFSYERLPQHH